MPELRGIIQSDLILRGALKAGLEELRANDWLLDTIMPDIVQDELTSRDYGQAEVQRLREWLLGLYEGAGTGILILDTPALEPPSWPVLTVEVLESDEAEDKLADLDADTSEDYLASTPVLAGPLTPAAYNPLTGALALPSSVIQAVTTDMSVYDRQGKAFPILGVTFVQASQVLALPAGSQPDLYGMTIRANSGERVALETAAFEETFRIGCHVATERAHLYYLHSIVLFVLLRGRQALLEARGLERTRVRSGAVQRMEGASQAIPLWSRYVTLTGVVRPVWPKARGGRIWSVSQQANLSLPGSEPTSFVGGSPGVVAPADEAWLAEETIRIR